MEEERTKKEEERSKKYLIWWTVGIVLVILFMCIGKYYEDEPFRTAEQMMEELPTVRPYLEEHIQLLEEVRVILDSHEDEYNSIGGNGENINVFQRDGSGENLADSSIFSSEEKEKIRELLTEECPLDYYGAGAFSVKDMRDGGMVDVYVTYIPEENLEEQARFFYYYSEEFAPNWFIGVTLNRFFIKGDIFEEYQSRLPGGGLVRLQ